MKKNKTKNIILLVVIAVTILRLAYFVRMPYWAIANTGFDDRYLLDIASSIMSGKWLGDYNYTTLIKGISYPLFVVFSSLTCIPYSVLLGLFYGFCCGMFALAFYKLFKNYTASACVYVFLLYTPAGFAVKVAQRLYRNAIIFPSVLLVLSCIIMVYVYRKESSKKQLMWLILLGFGFTFFYYIREDSFWLLPLLIGSLIIVAVWNLFFSGFQTKTKITRSCMLLLPFVILLGCSCIYKGINYSKYGVFTTNDRTSGSFAELTGNMIRVEDETNTNGDFWITRNKYENIVDACPTLAENKDIYMYQYDVWAEDGNDGNVNGDLSVWAVRIAFDELGYYSDAVTIDKICRQVNEELLQAVDEGRLSFDDAIHFTTQSRGVYTDEIPGFIKSTVKNIWDVAVYKDAQSELVISTGGDGRIRYMESLLGVSTIKSAEDVNSSYSERVVRNSNRIISVYRHISRLLFPAALACFLCLCYIFIRRRTWENFEPVIILLGFLLSICLCEFGITVFNTWLNDVWFYSTGIVPLCQCFEVLSIAYVIKNLNLFRRWKWIR